MVALPPVPTPPHKRASSSHRSQSSTAVSPSPQLGEMRLHTMDFALRVDTDAAKAVHMDPPFEFVICDYAKEPPAPAQLIHIPPSSDFDADDMSPPSSAGSGSDRETPVLGVRESSEHIKKDQFVRTKSRVIWVRQVTSIPSHESALVLTVNSSLTSNPQPRRLPSSLLHLLATYVSCSRRLFSRTNPNSHLSISCLLPCRPVTSSHPCLLRLLFGHELLLQPEHGQYSPLTSR